MKWYVVFVCLAVVIVTSQEAAVSEETGKEHQGDGERHKRSGDIIGFLGSKISAIASASGGLSSLSSASKPDHEPPAEEEKSFDFWAFKKALLSTLLQAAKAITGGIIAIKGQLIKAKGHILTTKGRLISTKGESISDFGKHVANSALNLDAPKNPPPHPSAPSAGYSSGPSGSSGFGSSGPNYSSGGAGYGLPPPPSISTSYGVPTAPSGLYGAPFRPSARGSSSKNAQPTAKSSSSLPNGAHAGLLVIKPIPSPASSGSGARESSYTSSNLHDFFGAPSHSFATFVAPPFDDTRRSDHSSFLAPESDYSIMPAFSTSYDL